MAQVAPPPEPGKPAAASDNLNDIIVTAQRRSQALKDVPISAVVFDSQKLERIGAGSLDDVLGDAANVSISNGGNRGRLDLTIRGVTSLAGDQRTFGIYVDGLNVAAVNTVFGEYIGSGINQRLLDIERIEVLRGPQGTYFGRNAIAGGISIVTKKPSYDFHIDGSLDYSSFDTLEAKSTINVPIVSNTLAFRGTALVYSSDGPVKNISDVVDPRSFIPPTSGNQYLNALDKSVNIKSSSSSERTLGLRGALRFQPTSNLTVDGSVTYQRSRFGIPQQTTLPIGYTDDGSPAPTTLDLYGGFINGDIGYFPQNRRRAAVDTAYGSETRSLLAVLSADWKLPGITISSITAFNRTATNGNFNDSVSRARDLVTAVDSVVKNRSQELRVTSDTDSPFQWFIGGFASKDSQYFNEAIYCKEPTCAGTGVASPATPIEPTFLFSATIPNDTVVNYAVFGEASYKIGERLTIAAGGRQSWERTKRLGFGNDIDGVELFQFENDKTRLKQFTPKVSVAYAVSSRANIYASATKGYRSGSVSTLEFGDVIPYGPEFIWNYEAGFKGSFFNGKVSTNLAVFQMDYTDIQTPQPTLVTIPGTNSTEIDDLISNVGQARLRGVELEVQTRPVEGLSVDAGVGYVNSKFLKDILDPSGAVETPLKGMSLPRSRKWSGNANVEYRFPVASTTMFVRGEFSAFSGTYESIRRIPADRLPGYSLVNLRVGGTIGRIDLTAYAENIFDKKYYTSTGDSLSTGTLVDVHPRVVGVRAATSF